MRAAVRTVVATLSVAALVACERVPVQSGVPERAANEILVVLDEAGIAARKERDTGAGAGARAQAWSVTVGASDAGHAFQVLSDHAMPRETPPGFADVLSGDSLIPTAAEERVRHRQALAGEIARTLESVRGVVEARVHLGLPEPVDLVTTADDAGPRPTASVLLQTATVAPPLPLDDVRRVVCGAVPGLEPAAVNVVFVAEPPPARPPTDGLVSIAGIRVAPSSVPGLRAMLGAALVAIVLLAAGLVATTLRRRLPRAPKELA
ncbi:MAG: secretion protein [Micrococcales bacterium]|nr:secretion protein [Micrococcales bacterium]